MLLSTTKRLTLFSLVMMTVVSVDNVRNLPAAALFGSQLITFYCLAAVLFFVPCALVSAELAATWPEDDGIYGWVKRAFNQKTALFAIWLQWIENVIWYPALLSFIAGTLGYLIHPDLPSSKSFLGAVIVLTFWGVTWINLKGITSTARFSDFCSVMGLLVPMSLIITLGAIWVYAGFERQIDLSLQAMVPSFSDPYAWVSLTGIMLSLCGIEIATVHARDVDNPQKNFPKALILSTIIILFTLVAGALSLILVVAPENISLVTGLMQGFDQFFQAFHLSWLLPIVGISLVIGGLGGMSNWIIAPTRGLLVAGQDGLLPPSLQVVNDHKAPSALLCYQAIFVSAITLAFTLLPNVDSFYWLLTVLAAQLYMMMYVMMFITVLRLRQRYPNHERPFSVPGGRFGIWLIAIAGVIGSSLTFLVSFIPPPHINVGDVWWYEVLLISGLVLFSAPPYFLLRYRQASWQQR